MSTVGIILLIVGLVLGNRKLVQVGILLIVFDVLLSFAMIASMHH